MNKLSVKIEYKNKDMETVIEKEYPFVQYVNMIASELTSVITDVENVFYTVENGEQRENWSPESQKRFKEIRHKLLDYSNSIRRLPYTLTYNGARIDNQTFGEFLSEAFKKGLLE